MFDCETCAYYDTDRNDQPCCGCDGGMNYVRKNDARRLNRSEVAEALVHCAGDNVSCERCALYVEGDDDCECSKTLKQYAAELITRCDTEVK